jgi:hypothetical protein
VRGLLLAAALLSARPALAQDPNDTAGFGPASSEAPGPGRAEDPDDAAGFGSTQAAVPARSQQTNAPVAASSAQLGSETSWSAALSVRSQWGLWLERLSDNPFARGRQSVDGAAESARGGLSVGFGVHAEYDLAYRHRRARFDRATLEEYESQLYLRDTFVSLEKGPLRLYVGRRAFAWGEGDLLSVLDVVVPRDMREPGLADIQDLRLPVLMTTIALQAGYHRLELIAVHEAHFGLRSPPRGPFSPIAPSPVIAEQGFQDVFLDDREAGFHARTQQFFARWSFRGPGFDFALYAASGLDQLGIIDGGRAKFAAEIDPTVVPPGSAPPPAAPDSFTILLHHPRYKLLGASSSLPFGSWLLKAEAVATFGNRVNVLDQSPLGFGSERTAVVGGMLGLGFSGISHAFMTAELSKVWLPAVDGELLFPLAAPAFAVRYTQSFLRDDLSVELVGSSVGVDPAYGLVARAGVSYRLFDSSSAGLGAITYQPTSRRSFISRFDTNDQLYLRLRQDF